MTSTLVIEKMTTKDWNQVCDIYLEGINSGKATFQTEIPTWEAFDQTHTKNCRIVARDDTKVIGWIALTPISNKYAYKGVAELSIYVADEARGKGIGNELLNALIKESEQEGYWTLQACILSDNQASLNLHKKHGFRVVGYREKIGRIRGEWRDSILLERRSNLM